MGVKGDFLALLESFLFERQQRVVLNGQESEWLTIKASVLQGSVLGPFFFFFVWYILTIYLIILSLM